MLRVLLKIPLPGVTVPRVLGIDDFALRRGLVYATVLTGAGTGRRVSVVPGRTAGAAGKWLRDHPGAEIVCRDGPGAYGEAVRQALPSAVQVSDRWHLWHGLGEAVRKEVAARLRIVLRRRYEPALRTGITQKCPQRWNLSRPTRHEDTERWAPGWLARCPPVGVLSARRQLVCRKTWWLRV